MVAIYTQDATYIRKDADSARSVLIDVYGQKFGEEAYVKIKNGREGTSYRANGGPLVRVVSKEQAAVICEKETQIGMM